MTKRRLLIGMGLLAVIAAVCYAVLWLTAPPRLRVENFEKVRVGMTRAEVEEVLGGPPGDYGSGEAWEIGLWAKAGSVVEPRFMRWSGQHTGIAITCDDTGRASWVGHFQLIRLQPESLLDRVRRWLKFS